MVVIVEDMAMDVVQKLLMFEDECILVDDVPVDHFVPLGRIFYEAPSHGKE